MPFHPNILNHFVFGPTDSRVKLLIKQHLDKLNNKILIVFSLCASILYTIRGVLNYAVKASKSEICGAE